VGTRHVVMSVFSSDCSVVGMVGTRHVVMSVF